MDGWFLSECWQKSSFSAFIYVEMREYLVEIFPVTAVKNESFCSASLEEHSSDCCCVWPWAIFSGKAHRARRADRNKYSIIFYWKVTLKLKGQMSVEWTNLAATGRHRHRYFIVDGNIQHELIKAPLGLLLIEKKKPFSVCLCCCFSCWDLHRGIYFCLSKHNKWSQEKYLSSPALKEHAVCLSN